MHPSRNRLMALIAANHSKPKRYEIQQKDDQATVYLYDMIDAFWGVSAKQFVKDLNSITAKTIHLRINSPGGDVFEGRAIATAIAQHPSNIIAHVDGLAASAASYVALAANEVEMAPGAFFMIHKAWTMAYGNADDLLATAGILEKIDASLVDEYVKQTGNTEAQVKDWLVAETWFTADESVTNGFADRVSSDEPTAKNAWDLSVFNRAPAEADPPDNTEQLEAEHAMRKRRAELVLKVA